MKRAPFVENVAEISVEAGEPLFVVVGCWTKITSPAKTVSVHLIILVHVVAKCMLMLHMKYE